MRLLSADAAVAHLLELASSMDSLVVGEREILRQLREAYDRCKTWGFTGDHLRLLVRFAIETAKEIYTHTAIGEGALSVVALAFAAMMQNGVQPDARVVMIGAGQTNTLFGKFLLKYGFSNVTIFNRTLERATTLAAVGNWQAYTLAQLPEFRKGFDVLVVCTGATEPVVHTREYHQLLGGEYTNKVVIDLALPNNVAPEVVATFPTQYVEIELLRNIAGENFAAREHAREHARTIVEARLPVFRERWKERQAERMLSHIPQEIRAVKDRATSEVFAKKIARLDGSAQALLQEMMDYMEKKCISIPMKVVKSMVQESGTAQNVRQK
jgi:glutamyl-tRNA reductase